jgi:uncharacterized glyoxalase superfamily protein PhnB
VPAPPQLGQRSSIRAVRGVHFSGLVVHCEKALRAKIETMMSYVEMPAMPAMPEGDAGCADGLPPSGDGIMHACLVPPGGAMLFAGDNPPGLPYEGVKCVMLAVQYETVDQAMAHSTRCRKAAT